MRKIRAAVRLQRRGQLIRLRRGFYALMRHEEREAAHGAWNFRSSRTKLLPDIAIRIPMRAWRIL